MQQDRLKVESDHKLLDEILEWFKHFCLKHLPQLGWSSHQPAKVEISALSDEISSLSLALVEGFTNAVRHAHRGLPPETIIEIELTLWEKDRLEIRIWDHGEPFDPDSLSEPAPGTLQVGGYGWYLLRRLTDFVVYERGSDNRNCLLLVKYGSIPFWHIYLLQWTIESRTYSLMKYVSS